MQQEQELGRVVGEGHRFSGEGCGDVLVPIPRSLPCCPSGFHPGTLV